VRRLLAALLAGASSATLACGYCVEDKIAATYDHAVVVRALGQKHQVAFFHVDGGTAAGRTALLRSAEATPGIDRGSVRVSDDGLTVSFAFSGSLGVVQASLEKKLASRGCSLMPLRILDKPGDLKAVTR
jgi:hypothetical protein